METRTSFLTKYKGSFHPENDYANAAKIRRQSILEKFNSTRKEVYNNDNDDDSIEDWSLLGDLQELNEISSIEVNDEYILQNYDLLELNVTDEFKEVEEFNLPDVVQLFELAYFQKDPSTFPTKRLDLRDLNKIDTNEMSNTLCLEAFATLPECFPKRETVKNMTNNARLCKFSVEADSFPAKFNERNKNVAISLAPFNIDPTVFHPRMIEESSLKQGSSDTKPTNDGLNDSQLSAEQQKQLLHRFRRSPGSFPTKSKQQVTDLGKFDFTPIKFPSPERLFVLHDFHVLPSIFPSVTKAVQIITKEAFLFEPNLFKFKHDMKNFPIRV